MKSLIFIIFGLLVGILLIVSGVYYLRKESDDKDSVKIYGTFIAIGAIMTIGIAIKTIVSSF